MFSDVAYVREICNGIMATTALVTFVVFGEYMVRYLLNKENWTHMPFQAAAAVLTLMVGHFIRAGTNWAGFLVARLDGHTEQGAIGEPWWFNAGWIFALATAIVVLGKLWVIMAFAPDSIWLWGKRFSWRVHLKVAFVVALGVPFLVGALWR